jgi:hypothetical protein
MGELRKTDGITTKSQKQPGRENGKESKCRFFDVFAPFVVS